MKLLILLLISACCGGMTPERRLSVQHEDMPPIIINVPAGNDAHRFIVYEERSDHDKIEEIKQQMERKTETSKPATPSLESDASTDSVSKRHHQKWLAITNGITAVSVAAITAAVTLAVHFSSKCPNTPTGTP